MNKKFLVSLAACAVLAGSATPSIAAEGALGSAASFFGTTTALVVDVPEGMLVNSLYHSPRKATRALAEAFGDEKGLQQNVVGALIGIPFGLVWGIPTGAIQGGRHAFSVGWEKPFSTESYIVSEEK